VRFDGRKVAVTGGLGELGFAIAEALARRGARVVLLDREDGAAAVEKLAADGLEAFGVRADVADEAQVEAAIAAAAARWGGLDGLVNNAGAFIGFKPARAIRAAEWQQVFAVDALGSFLCARAALPYLEKSGRGRIVNIGSDSSDAGTPGLLAHLSAKGAVASLTRGLASEFGASGITVNAVIPGLFETERAREQAPAFLWERERERQALRDRNTRVEDVVGPVLMLLSDHAARVTGQCIHVNSGSRYA
jgi:NAD(P)-dependent dehydrogenase (short-subunit alcohol dehydrogenase family)